MSDLIDRQELLKHKGNCYDEEGHLLYAVGTGTILLMHTEDAVEVVRCKDCRYYDAENHNCLDELGYARVWEEDDYCSFAERRKDGKTD